MSSWLVHHSGQCGADIHVQVKEFMGYLRVVISVTLVYSIQLQNIATSFACFICM